MIEELRKEIARCKVLAEENENESRSWWLARISGLGFALALTESFGAVK